VCLFVFLFWNKRLTLCVGKLSVTVISYRWFVLYLT